MLFLSDNQKEVLFNALKETLMDMTFEGGRDTQTDLYGNAGGYKTILSAKTWKNPCLPLWQYHHKEAYMGGSVYYCPTLSTDKEINVHILLAPFIYDAKELIFCITVY